MQTDICPTCGCIKFTRGRQYKGLVKKACNRCSNIWTTVADYGNVFAFSCPHFPFNHPRYLDWCRSMVDKYECKTIVCLGDMFDNHAISYHETDPNGYSASHEFKLARDEAAKWAKAFPDMIITEGNHDLLIQRKAKTHGLPEVCFKTLNDIWELPDTWTWHDRVVMDEVVYHHGTGKSGKYMHINWAAENMLNSVTGHGHSNAGVGYQASPYGLLWGLGVGCGIDVKSFAMAYGKDFGKRPLIGAGVIMDNGNAPMWRSMDLGV